MWKKRFSIKQLMVCSESGDVQGEKIDSWKTATRIGEGIFQ